MSDTGLLSRIVYRKKKDNRPVETYWASSISGSRETEGPAEDDLYRPFGKPLSIPSPIGDTNMEDISTLEDETEVQVAGRKSAASMTLQISFESASRKKIALLESANEELDIIIMYGRKGHGEEGICAFNGTVTFAPDEATEGHLTATVTVAIKTKPIWLEKPTTKRDYSVPENTETIDYIQTDQNGYPTFIELVASAA